MLAVEPAYLVSGRCIGRTETTSPRGVVSSRRSPTLLHRGRGQANSCSGIVRITQPNSKIELSHCWGLLWLISVRIPGGFSRS